MMLYFSCITLASGDRQLVVHDALLPRHTDYRRHSQFHSTRPRKFQQCESKKSPRHFLAFFSKRLGMFSQNFTRLLYVPINAKLQIFIQLSATLTKLCHIKRDHLVHIICSKCSPFTETHAGIFPKQLGILGPNFTHLLHVPIYARWQILPNYLQLQQSYAILSATTQRAFQLMADILSIGL